MSQTDAPQQTSDAQPQKTAKDSQLSSISQLGSGDSAMATRTSWSTSAEPTSGQLNLNSMFGSNNLASELGLGSGAQQAGANPGDSLINEGKQLQQFGTELSAIGTDLNNISKDMSTLSNDINGLLNSLGNAVGGYGGSNGSDNPGTTPTGSTGSDNPGTTPTGSTGSDNPGTTPTGSTGSDNPGTTPTGSTGSDNPGTTPTGSTGSDNPGTTPTGSTGSDNPGTTPTGLPGTDNPGPTTTSGSPGTDNPGTTTTSGSPGTDNPGTTPTSGSPGTDNPGTTNPAGSPGSDTTGATGSSSRTPGTPFASDSIFNMPLGTGAQWEANSQLDSAGVYINTNGNYNEPIYTSSASDPLVTVTSDGAAGGGAGTFQVHIPAGATAAVGGDQTFTVNDTSQNTWFSFGGFNWTGPDSATVSQGSSEPFNGSGMTQDNSNWDEGVGTLTGGDLQAGNIDHMLRMELPTTMLESYTNDTNQLAPFAYPQTAEDGFAVNGNGGPAYSGTVPYGVTIGIPQGVAEPADVQANAGADMLWHALQNHGAMVRDSGGSGNNVIFQTDQNVQDSNPLVQGMEQYGSEIMAATQILTNQGPNSVNGGGTPVVPLDGPPVEG